VLPPDHGTPDRLGAEAQRSERWREFEGAGRTEPDEIEVLNLRTREAEIEKVDRPQAQQVRLSLSAAIISSVSESGTHAVTSTLSPVCLTRRARRV
jgi:hypothetical protein